MAVRYTGSTAILEEIRDVLKSSASASETILSTTNENLDEMLVVLKKTHVGHELHLWGQEVEEEE